MNRKQRRQLNKGDLETRKNKLEDADKALRQKEQYINQMIVSQGKEYASYIVQTELMPIIRDVLHINLKVSDEQITIFEEAFKKKFSKRVEGLGIANEKVDKVNEGSDNEPAGTANESVPEVKD